MQIILRFFAKNGPFFTWLVLVIFSIVLLCHTNPYQRSVWFGGANVLSGGVNSVADGVTGYFGLREVNSQLMEQMARLEEQNQQLRLQLQTASEHDSLLLVSQPYSFVVAHAIDNSITRAENYLVINKGAADSIKVGMAVANQSGAIGQVAATSGHFAQVISLLNPKFNLSVCIQSSLAAGGLVWDGKSPEFARLENLPRNVPYQIGDSVITSGYGGSFPRGVYVGRIVEVVPSSDNNFLAFKVELGVHFERINDVFVINNNNMPCQF